MLIPVALPEWVEWITRQVILYKKKDLAKARFFFKSEG